MTNNIACVTDDAAVTSLGNPEFMAYCVENGWCASPSFMTKAEAAAVTITNYKFPSPQNSNPTDLWPLEHFTGVTAVSDYANFPNVTRLKFPVNQTGTNQGMLRGLRYLEEVFMSAINNVPPNCFDGCTALHSITLPKISAPELTWPNYTHFGSNADNWTGRATYDRKDGNGDPYNKLIVPVGAVGYESGEWATTLLNPDKCGFMICKTLIL